MNAQQILGLIAVIFVGLMMMQCMGQQRVVYVNAAPSYATQPRYLAVPQQQYQQRYAYGNGGYQPTMRRQWCPPRSGNGIIWPHRPQYPFAQRGPVPNVFRYTDQGRRVYQQYVRRPQYGGPQYMPPRYAMPPRRPNYGYGMPRPPQVYRPQPPRGYYGGGGYQGGGHHRRH